MGRATCEAVKSDPGMELVAELGRGADIPALSGKVDVAVDFTLPSATQSNVRSLIDAGIHAVVGTTGWTEAALRTVEERLAGTDVGVVIAPNFALSAVLAMKFAAQAAKYFESAEVIEMHHPDKVDAPSGTALHTARGIAAARAAAGLPSSPDATQTGREARGKDVDGVKVHAVRLRGLVAHEEILFGNPGEQLLIRTDSFDRDSFMPGVLLAIRAVVSRPGLTHGLDPLLDL